MERRGPATFGRAEEVARSDGWPLCNGIPRIADAIAGGCELLEVRCRRCSHESLIDLTEVVWPREKPVHTLANVLRCQACKDEGKSRNRTSWRCGHGIPRAIRQWQNGCPNT